MSEVQSPPVAELPLVYNQIKVKLLQRLLSQWPAGTRLPPIPELARQLGTGHRSTHRAVRELADEGMLVSRRGQGTYVTPGLTPKKIQQVLKATHDKTAPSGAAGPLTGTRIGIIRAGLADGFISLIIEALKTALNEAGARVDSVPVDLTQPNDFRLFADRSEDALVVINPTTDRRHPILCDPRQKLSIISTTAGLPIAIADGFDVVTADEQQGGVLAGQYLRRIGCQTACYIGVHGLSPDAYDETSAARLSGFEYGWGEPLPVSHQLICKRYGEVSSARVLDPLYMSLDPRPDAVFAASDELARGILVAAASHGLEAGRDYQLVGFDRQQRGSAMNDGLLTSVEVPCVKMAQQAVILLAKRFVDPDRPPQRLHLGCKLFIGGTSAPEPSVAQ